MSTEDKKFAWVHLYHTPDKPYYDFSISHCDVNISDKSLNGSASLFHYRIEITNDVDVITDFITDWLGKMGLEVSRVDFPNGTKETQLTIESDMHQLYFVEGFIALLKDIEGVMSTATDCYEE